MVKFTLLLAAIALPLQAATLTCDWMPYSADGSNSSKANLVQYSDDGGATWNDFNTQASNDGTLFRIYEPFDSEQPVDWTLRAYNSVWARESAHVPFTWDGEGPIVAPGGNRVIP